MAMTSGQPASFAAAETRSVTILGSTGSVGCQTIDLIERQPDHYTVEALTANRNVELLARQAKLLKPKFVALADPEGYGALKDALSHDARRDEK